MKLFLTAFCFMFIFSCIAQGDNPITDACASPKQCIYNLNMPIPQYSDANSTVLIADRCYAKACRNIDPPPLTPSDYHDVVFKGMYNNGEDCPKPVNNDCTNDIHASNYRVFYPSILLTAIPASCLL